MLKKVGMVAAAATAGLIALSPLAFAGDKGYDGHHGHHGYHGYPDEVTNVWIDDDSVQRNQVNECEFEQEIENAGLLPVDALVTQDQSFNCVNAGDDAELPEPEPAPVVPVIPPVIPIP